MRRVSILVMFLLMFGLAFVSCAPTVGTQQADENLNTNASCAEQVCTLSFVPEASALTQAYSAQVTGDDLELVDALDADTCTQSEVVLIPGLEPGKLNPKGTVINCFFESVGPNVRVSFSVRGTNLTARFQEVIGVSAYPVIF